jgi:sugar phosphate permease
VSTFQIWVRGILAAMIGGASSAAAAALAAPQAFNGTHDGMIAFAKVIAIGAALPTLAYLKQSPLPTSSVTVTNEQTVTATKN